jgi:hypothetical protein
MLLVSEEDPPQGGRLWLWISAMFVLVLVFYGSLLLRDPEFFHRNDNVTLFLPAYGHSARGLARGELALMNYHQYAGLPHLAPGQSGTLYPPVYLAYALAGACGHDLWTLDFLLLFHILVASLGVFFLVLRRKESPELAILVGCAWVTIPMGVQLTRCWIPVSFVMALLPWNQLFLERLLEDPSARRGISLAIVKTFLLFCGMPQFAVMAGVYDCVYLGFLSLFDGPRSAGKKWLAYLVTVALSLALGAVYLLPFWGQVSHSLSRSAPLKLWETLYGAVTPREFFQAQRGIFRRGFFFTLSSSALFIGPVPLLLLVVGGGMVFRKNSQGWQRSLYGACLVALFLSTRGHQVLTWLPLLGRFRWPFKQFLWFHFFLLLWLSGLGRGKVWRRLLWGSVLLGHGLVGHGDSFRSLLGIQRALPPGGGGRQAKIRERFLPVGPPSRLETAWHGGLDQMATVRGDASLGGSEVLVSREHAAVALGVGHPPEMRYTLPVREVGRRLQHLRTWGVGRLLMAPNSSAQAMLEKVPGIYPDGTASGHEALRFRVAGALPLVRPADLPLIELPIHFGFQGLTVDLGGFPQERVIEIAVVHQDAYRAYADGRPTAILPTPFGAPIRVRAPAGTRTLILRYQSWELRLGLWISGLSLLGILLRLRREPES